MSSVWAANSTGIIHIQQQGIYEFNTYTSFSSDNTIILGELYVSENAFIYLGKTEAITITIKSPLPDTEETVWLCFSAGFLTLPLPPIPQLSKQSLNNIVERLITTPNGYTLCMVSNQCQAQQLALQVETPPPEM